MSEVHEVLIDQLPAWFKPVLEYIEIMRAGGGELAEFDALAARIRANTHIQTADSETLRYWERLLGISVTPGATLDYRRERILVRINQTVPYTYWDLRDALTELFGEDYTLEVNPEECWIRIFITSDRYGATALLHDLIYSYVPAHLYVYSNQQVTNTADTGMYMADRMSRTFEQVIGTGGN